MDGAYDGNIFILGILLEEGDDGGGRGRIEAACWLIEEEHNRPLD